jgi:transposase-like protein
VTARGWRCPCDHRDRFLGWTLAPIRWKACFVANAAQQTERNQAVAAARAAGASVSEIAARFGLSQSRVKQILKATPVSAGGHREALALAVERRREYSELVGELRALARRLPDTQASSKVGAYRGVLDALDRLTALERALGFLPHDLGRLGGERALVEAVVGVFLEHDVPDEARRALVARLEPGEARR